MDSIKVPEIPCPIPGALNSYAGEGDRYAVEWASAHGMLPDGDLYGIEAARLGHLAGYAHPRAGAEAVRIAVAWLDWLMVYDDALFDKQVNVTKLDNDRITAIHRDLLGILDGEPVADDAGPLHRGMRDLYRAMRDLAPNWDMTEFRTEFRKYFQSNLWEATNIWRTTPPHLSVYTTMRRHTGCLFAMYQLSSMLNGITLPATTADHVAVRQLEIMANNYTCWLNDVYSFERERRDGQVNNLVAVLAAEHATTYQRAAELAVEMCRIEMDSYLELKQRLPRLGLDVDESLADYLGVLESWMRALSDWHRMTARYQVGP
jgi:5-epi-alpha-selinene synthase